MLHIQYISFNKFSSTVVDITPTKVFVFVTSRKRCNRKIIRSIKRTGRKKLYKVGIGISIHMLIQLLLGQ